MEVWMDSKDLVMLFNGIMMSSLDSFHLLKPSKLLCTPFSFVVITKVDRALVRAAHKFTVTVSKRIVQECIDCTTHV